VTPVLQDPAVAARPG